MNDYDPNYVEKKTFFRVGQKAVVINSSNQILLLKRSQKTGGGGKWSLPGGAIEEGEDPEESIRREIKEETEMEVINLTPIKARSYKNGADETLIIGYKCQSDSSEVKLNWEHDEFKWVSKEEAQDFDLSEDARFFIEIYGQ